MNTDTKQHVHEEHLEWLQEVTYWHNELIYYDNLLLRLLESTHANGDVEEIEEFKNAIDSKHNTFIAIDGPGGIGKTQFVSKCIEKYISFEKKNFL